MLRAESPPAASSFVLKPARVFDGEAMHDAWVVARGRAPRSSRRARRPRSKAPAGATEIDLPSATLLPGLIEAHSHILLHPYTEASWNHQVSGESDALRVARATNSLRATLLAGFTTIRDLGTEGAGWADVGLKQAVERGIIPGPRMLVATKAIVATGSYGPKGFSAEWTVPQGAAEASGVPDLIRETRNQIGHGADWIKVYADGRWGPNGEMEPTFSLEELKAVVETARSSGRPVAAHAMTAEGMRRAVLAGVETIEHGTNGTPEVFRLMKEHGVALIPTLAVTGGMAGAKEAFRAALAVRRHDRQRQRRGGLCARQQRPRAGRDGAVRHAGRRRPARGHLGQRPDPPHRGHGRPDRARPAGRPGRRRGQSRRATSAASTPCGWS